MVCPLMILEDTIYYLIYIYISVSVLFMFYIIKKNISLMQNIDVGMQYNY